MKHENRLLVIVLPIAVISFEYSMSSTWTITKEDTEQIPNNKYHTFFCVWVFNQIKDSCNFLQNYFSEANLLHPWQFSLLHTGNESCCSHYQPCMLPICSAGTLPALILITVWEAHIKFFKGPPHFFFTFQINKCNGFEKHSIWLVSLPLWCSVLYLECWIRILDFRWNCKDKMIHYRY